MQCLPMASLLLALGNPTVNYLSLDLEGAELEVPLLLLDLVLPTAALADSNIFLVLTGVQDFRHNLVHIAFR